MDGIKVAPLFLDSAVLEKKKLAASISVSWNDSAIDWAIADFPAPAAPYNQNIFAGSSALAQAISLSRIPSRVNLAQRGGLHRSLESNSAPREQYLRRWSMAEYNMSAHQMAFLDGTTLYTRECSFEFCTFGCFISTYPALSIVEDCN